MPDGANLRTTRLNREKLIVAIKRGVPGKGMPAFDRLAYSDGCRYGMKQADLERTNLTMPDPAATYRRARSSSWPIFCSPKWWGKGPMDRARCIEFWGSDVATCAEFSAQSSLFGFQSSKVEHGRPFNLASVPTL